MRGDLTLQYKIIFVQRARWFGLNHFSRLWRDTCYKVKKDLLKKDKTLIKADSASAMLRTT